jgi:hypothetical protein
MIILGLRAVVLVCITAALVIIGICLSTARRLGAFGLHPMFKGATRGHSASSFKSSTT